MSIPLEIWPSCSILSIYPSLPPVYQYIPWGLQDEHPATYRKCPSYIFECEVALIRNMTSLTLKTARMNFSSKVSLILLLDVALILQLPKPHTLSLPPHLTPTQPSSLPLFFFVTQPESILSLSNSHVHSSRSPPLWNSLPILPLPLLLLLPAFLLLLHLLPSPIAHSEADIKKALILNLARPPMRYCLLLSKHCRVLLHLNVPLTTVNCFPILPDLRHLYVPPHWMLWSWTLERSWTCCAWIPSHHAHFWLLCPLHPLLLSSFIPTLSMLHPHRSPPLLPLDLLLMLPPRIRLGLLPLHRQELSSISYNQELPHKNSSLISPYLLSPNNTLKVSLVTTPKTFPTSSLPVSPLSVYPVITHISLGL